MPIHDLHQTLATIRDRIAEHRAHIGAVERRTRQLLVEPLLGALGWQLCDPHQVEIQPRLQFTSTAGIPRADYALRNTERRLAYIEVVSLDSREMLGVADQTLSNASADGVEYCVVTDGDTWSLIDVFEPEYSARRNLVEFRVTRDSLVECALRSLALWRDNISDGSVPVRAEHPRVAPIVDVRRSRTVATGTFDLTDPRLKVTRHSPPSVVIDHTGTSVRTSSWIGFLVAVANALVDDHRITRSDCPIKTSPGRAICLINTAPIHPNGKRFKTPKQLRGGLYLEGDRYVRDCYNYARFLLQFANIPLTSVKFSLS